MRQTKHDAGSIHNHPIVHVPTPIDLNLRSSNPSDLNEESEVEGGDTGKGKNSVSSSVDALDGKTYSSAAPPFILELTYPCPYPTSNA